MKFKLFDVTIPNQAKEFKDFGPLNSVIERDNISPDALRQAYYDMVLGVLSDTQKTDIHGQIQYLFDEVKIPINRVLYFLDAKFGSLADAIASTISKSRLAHTSISQGISTFADMSLMGRIESAVLNPKTQSQKIL